MLQLREQWNLGYKAAEARKQGDESRAQFNQRHSDKMVNLSDDRNSEEQAFRMGYTMYSTSELSDNPFTK